MDETLQLRVTQRHIDASVKCRPFVLLMRSPGSYPLFTRRTAIAIANGIITNFAKEMCCSRPANRQGLAPSCQVQLWCEE
jgi:hypothetical protein